MLYGDKLANTLREMSESAQRRLWIYSPYIGSWDGVKRILGDDWCLKGAIHVRLLTDIRNEGWIDPKTFSTFKKRGEVATLPGLHAKIYVADKQIIITSANLTRTAFEKRYEAGIIRNCTTADETYLKFLWKEADDIPKSWKPKKQKWSNGHDEQGGSGLRSKWKLPEIPRGTGDSSYEKNLAAFAEFRAFYLKHVELVWPKSPVYFEIDSFLNYLFHEHPKKPSAVYKDRGRASISERTRIKRANKYHNLFRTWVKTEKSDDAAHREEYHRKVRMFFAPSKIRSATWKDIENALSHVWALHSNHLNEFKFFNRGNVTNNTLLKVRDAFQFLFDDTKGPLSSRFRYCNENLIGMGSGAIGELIGYYYPEQFPLVNNNSLSGLRFFGYDV
jgi:hypothetical protein